MTTLHSLPPRPPKLHTSNVLSSDLEDYEFIDFFAKGGVAEIYRARNLHTGEIVVVKRIQPQLSSNIDAVESFVREGQLALLFDHKNLIHGLGFGEHNGLDFMILEYVDGQTLRKILQRAQEKNFKIPLSFALFLVDEILDGLHFAHELKNSVGESMGLVHRDLTPHNIFVRYDGHIRVGDFGAALSSAEEPIPSEIVGSPGYMSPEQATRKNMDRRSDLFAVGCILFEMLVGAPVFDTKGRTDEQILWMHQRGVPKGFADAITPELRSIIEKACHTDVNQRYVTAAQMQEDVKRVAPPADPNLTLGIATLLRGLFRQEFVATRLPGSPVEF